MGYSELRRKIRDAETCSHSETILCKRKVGRGAIQALHQCKKCGERVGDFISHSKLGRISVHELPDWSEELFKNSREHLASQTQEAWQKLKVKEIDSKIRDYDEYLNSPEWRKKADLVLKRDRHICQSCLENRATQVHHLSYFHIFEEPLFESVAVCPNCHERLHPESRMSLRRLLDSMMSATDPKYAS